MRNSRHLVPPFTADARIARARLLLEENLARGREVGSSQIAGHAILDVGILALHEDSVTLFVESLENGLSHGLAAIVARSLRGLAAATAVRGDLESAARMLGAAETIEEQIDDTMQPYERAAHAAALTPVVDRADEPEIATAWAAGRAMTKSDAAAYALATRRRTDAVVAPLRLQRVMAVSRPPATREGRL